MIANNIFRAIGSFFENVAFKPFDYFRSIDIMDGWWASNAINTVLILIGFVYTFYWLGEMNKHAKSGNNL